MSDRATPGHGTIIDGAYQCPILVQWHASPRLSRDIIVTLSRFS